MPWTEATRTLEVPVRSLAWDAATRTQTVGVSWIRKSYLGLVWDVGTVPPGAPNPLLTASFLVMTLSWDAVTNATGYQAQVKERTQEWSAATELTETAMRTASHTGEDGKIYDFRVRAILPGGTFSAWSLVLWWSPSAENALPYITLSSLTFSNGSWTITWQAPPGNLGVTGYGYRYSYGYQYGSADDRETSRLDNVENTTTQTTLTVTSPVWASRRNPGDEWFSIWIWAKKTGQEDGPPRLFILNEEITGSATGTLALTPSADESAIGALSFAVGISGDVADAVGVDVAAALAEIAEAAGSIADGSRTSVTSVVGELSELAKDIVSESDLGSVYEGALATSGDENVAAFAANFFSAAQQAVAEERGEGEGGDDSGEGPGGGDTGTGPPGGGIGCGTGPCGAR